MPGNREQGHTGLRSDDRLFGVTSKQQVASCRHHLQLSYTSRPHCCWIVRGRFYLTEYARPRWATILDSCSPLSG